MKNLSVWQRLLVVCLLLGPALSAGAAESSPALKQLFRSFINEHPAAQAARANLVRAEAQARATGQPLYNPEIEINYEDATDVTKTIGLVQTFDWSGKRRARDTAGQDTLRAAQATVAATRQDMLGELLMELSGIVVSSEAARLARNRVELLDEFRRIAERRYAAGDVGQTDVDLAQLAASEARMQAAAISAEAFAGEARLAALVQMPAQGWPTLPALPENIAPFDADELLQQHPALRQSQAAAAAARATIDIARRERRPDPTIGVRGGKEDDDGLIGVTVSIPLYVRNTFRDELVAANAEATRAEQAYYDIQRRANSALQAAVQRYRLTRTALVYWEKSGKSSLRGRVDLLKRLWEIGEISTTDYLVQLQQTLDTEASAVALQSAAWSAWIAWLKASGQTERWLEL